MRRRWHVSVCPSCMPRSARSMHFSAGRSGFSPGQPVAMYRTNDRRCFHWFLAIIRAGGIAVPLNPHALARRGAPHPGRQRHGDSGYGQSGLRAQHWRPRARCSVRTWIQADDEAETLDGISASLRHAERRFPPTAIDPAATIAVFHTSGTSGFPKGAALSSNALLGARASTVLAGLFLGPRDLALIALPWSHIMAVSIALYGLMAGIRGCFLDRFDVETRAGSRRALRNHCRRRRARDVRAGWSTAIPILRG